LPQTFDELVVKFTADLSGLKASMDNAASQVEQFRTKTDFQLAALSNSFKTLEKAALAFGVALSLKAAVDLGKSALETSMKVQALQFQLLAATGSTQAAADASDFAAQMADKYGLAVLSVEKQLSSFLLATRGTTLTLKESKDAFEGVSVYATAMGLTANNVTRGMIAFQEVMGMGTLRAQQMQMLIRDLHISYQMMADAVDAAGGSVEKLRQLMKNGEVDGKEAILALTAAMKEQFGDIAAAASQTLEGNLNRLGNQWVELQTVFGQSGGLQAGNVAVHALGVVLEDLEPVAKAVAEEFLGLEILIADLVKYWQLLELEVGGLINIFGALGDELEAVGTAAKQVFEGDVTGAAETMKAATSALDKQLDDMSANGHKRAQEIIDDYNKAVKSILTPYSMPDINKARKTSAGGEGGNELSDSKRHSLQEQVRHVEEYSDDDGDKLKSQLEEHQKVLENALKQRVITKTKFDEDMLKLQQDYDKRVAAYVAKNFGDEIDQEQEDYKERLKALDKALKDKLITQQKYDEMVEKAQKDHQKKMVKAENDYNSQMRSLQRQGLDAFLGTNSQYQKRTLDEQGASFRDSISQAAQYNKTFFELDKAAKIAQALLSARQSVVDAYAFGTSLGGPALGAAFAGVAAAAQAANIAAIASTSFGSTGSVSSASSSDPGITTSTDAPSPNADVTSSSKKTIHLTLQGSGFTQNDIRKLIDDLNDALDNGSVLNV
jgi:tape measure domain-containing protein